MSDENVPVVHPSADVADSAVLGAGTRVWHLAQVREDAVLGDGCVIGRGAYIGTGVHLGNHCKVQNHALVYEPAELGDGVFIGPAVVLTNDRLPAGRQPGPAPEVGRRLARGRASRCARVRPSGPAPCASRRW